MNISINSDVEKDYRGEVVNGFSASELVCVIIAIVIIFGCAVVCYFKFGISPKYGCYIGIPLGFPVVYCGFRKFQGLNIIEYMKEISYHHKTKDLAYDAEELEEEITEFTIRRRRKKNK